MRPLLVMLGPVAVYSYGVTLALAFLACWLFGRWYLSAHRLDRTLATDLLLAAAVGGIVGARIVYVASNWPYYAADPLKILMLQQGGMVFYGGLAGGAAAVAILVRVKRLPVAVIADGAAMAVPLGSAIGRLGCFLNGCCGGVATTSILGVTFPGGSGPVLPTQIIDSAANLAIFGTLLAVHVRRRPVPGALWWAFAVMYGISRFLVEMIRTTPRFALGLTQAQWVSIPLVIAGVIGLTILLTRVRRYARSSASDPDDRASAER